MENLSDKLKSHEKINEHITKMNDWADLEIIWLNNKNKIDKKMQEQIKREKRSLEIF